MAKIGKSMSMASRLAAATALTGTLAACDGRFGQATDAMFAPVSKETSAELARRSPAPAAPGNPVYIEGSRAANDAAYQQAYGAPVQGSGQEIATPPTYASSVYQDSTISATPITDIPGGPVIDAGVPSPSYTTQSVGFSQPIASQPQYSSTAAQPQFSAPISSPTSGAFPSLDAQPVYTPVATQPVYLPQSSLPQSQGLSSEYFTDASAEVGARDIEPLLSAMPEQSVPYGSSASHRYSVAQEPLPTIEALPEYTPMQYSMPLEMIEDETMSSSFATAAPIDAAPIETVEVASLGGFVPMPRARPSTIGPVFKAPEVAAVAPVVPKARPNVLRTSPLPVRRPLQMASLSGMAITDAPALTEPPQMIEVEAVFVDEPIVEVDTQPVVETAALAPVMDTPKVMVDAPAPMAPTEDKAPEKEEIEITVIKPEDLEREMAALDTSKLTEETTEEIMIAAEAPRVEIASDVGDLKELSGTSWRLASLNGTDVPASAELHFDGGSGFAGGQGICNNYGGEFSESLQGEFEMENIFSTETECDHFALEKKYIVALETAKQYRMAPGLNELMLLGPDGKTIATFAAF